MSWLPIFFVFLALCMIAGPIMMLKPTRWQRNLAQLRARASSLGLRVHLGHIGGKELAVYQMPWPAGHNLRYADRAWCLERKNYEHDIHIDGFWYWQNEIRPAPAVVAILARDLPALPDGVMGVIGNSQGLGCFWDERGGEEAQKGIRDWLQQARDEIWPQVRREVDRDDESNSG